MLNEAIYMQNFYHDQNIQIRKEVRQMDMQFKEVAFNKNTNSQTAKQEQALRQGVSFLVIGPQKSGKSSLLKTMYFALNSNLNIEVNTSQLPSTLIKRFDIKKNKKYNIQGLAKMKQTDQKRIISGFQFQSKYSSHTTKQLSSQQKSNKNFQKYSNALQTIDNKVFGCFKISSISGNNFFKSQNQSSNGTNTSSFSNIKTVLIVLNILGKIQFQEITCLKFFLTDVKQKGVKALIILTHLDKLNHLKENDKLTLIEERIGILKKDLDIKDRDDFICIQSYRHFGVNANYKPGQVAKYVPQASGTANCQSPQNSLKQSYNQTNAKYSQGDIFAYKKVSQAIKNDFTSPMIQVPMISKNQKNFTLYQSAYQKHQQQIPSKNYHSGIIQNPNEQSRYAMKVHLNNHSPMNNIPQNNTQKPVAKKLQSHVSFHQQLYNRNSSKNLPSFVNNEEINYYSLKLLMKIINENQKYVSREVKNRKMIKWFCG